MFHNVSILEGLVIGAENAIIFKITKQEIYQQRFLYTASS